MPEPRAGAAGVDPLRDAADWFAALNDDHVDASTLARWRQWLAADAAHAHAWQRVEAMRARFAGLPAQVDPQVARQALDRTAVKRRRTVKAIGGLVLLVGAGGLARQVALEGDDWLPWAGDLRTGVGERRRWTLADGSDLWLNTDSAVRLRFDERLRALRLLHGEVLVTAVADPRRVARPFAIDTAEGEARTRVARLALRRDSSRSTLSVLDGRVDLVSAATQAARMLGAHESATLDRHGMGPVTPVRALRTSWSTGMLVADDLPLAEVVAELGRYVAGRVDCAADVAGLRVVGAFPVDDPDRAWRALEAALPIRVERRWGWWTHVTARRDGA